MQPEWLFRFHRGQIFVGAPNAVAHFSALGNVDHNRQLAVVADEVGLAAEGNEAVDFGSVGVGHCWKISGK